MLDNEDFKTKRCSSVPRFSEKKMSHNQGETVCGCLELNSDRGTSNDEREIRDREKTNDEQIVPS